MNKLTKKIALEAALCAIAGNPIKEYRNGEVVFTAEEVSAKLMEMFNALDKNSGSEKKMTEQQIANLGFKSDMLALMADGKARTATEILNEVPTFAGTNMTNQRVSALLRQLILDGKVKKDFVKDKAYFSVVEGV